MILFIIFNFKEGGIDNDYFFNCDNIISNQFFNKADKKKSLTGTLVEI
jgi:hypothetical protein